MAKTENQDGDTGAHRIVVLTGDVNNIGTDDFGHFSEDSCQTIGVVFLVDIFEVLLADVWPFGVADIVNIEGERLGQVVETL